jgi:hypothetical protein
MPKTVQYQQKAVEQLLQFSRGFCDAMISSESFTFHLLMYVTHGNNHDHASQMTKTILVMLKML